ncbi:unnamed protein product [Urochloa humidicola]
MVGPIQTYPPCPHTCRSAPLPPERLRPPPLCRPRCALVPPEPRPRAPPLPPVPVPDPSIPCNTEVSKRPTAINDNKVEIEHTYRRRSISFYRRRGQGAARGRAARARERAGEWRSREERQRRLPAAPRHSRPDLRHRSRQDPCCGATSSLGRRGERRAAERRRRRLPPRSPPSSSSAVAVANGGDFTLSFLPGCGGGAAWELTAATAASSSRTWAPSRIRRRAAASEHPGRASRSRCSPILHRPLNWLRWYLRNSLSLWLLPKNALAKEMSLFK